MDKTLLDRISIASPCSADWNQMVGDERRRFCASCKLHVHDLSGMTRDEALALVQQQGQGRVCVRFFRRADGTVLTRDCPVGLRQKLRRAWARAGALWLALWGSAACARPTADPEPATPREFLGERVMGDVAVPSPSPAQPAPHEHMGLVGPPPQDGPKEAPKK
jgi:hypothetical protein